MATRTIIQYPDPLLSQKAEPIKEISEDLRVLVRDMKETVKAHKGVGLAGPQVGVSKQVIVVLLDEEKEPEAFFNPEIISSSREKEADEEGCLSIDPEHIRVQVKRHRNIRIRAIDERGRQQVMQAEGLIARIFQHEIDHINGILILNRIGFIQKLKLYRRLARLKKAYRNAHA